MKVTSPFASDAPDPAAFRALAEAVGDPCWIAGADGAVLWRNPAGVAALGSAAVPAASGPVQVEGTDGVRRDWTAQVVALPGGGRCGTLRASAADEGEAAFLRGFAEAVRDLADPPAILGVMARMLAAHLRCNQVVFTSFVAPPALTAQVFRVRDGQQLDYPGELQDYGRPPLTELSRAYRTGQTLVVRDNAEGRPPVTPGLARLAQARGARSAISVPIIKEGQLVAILSAMDAAPRDWQPSEVALVEELAERAWGTLGRAQVEAALRERDRHGAFLLDWSDRVRPLRDPAAILALTLTQLRDHLGADRAVYAERDGAGFAVRAAPDDGGGFAGAAALFAGGAMLVRDEGGADTGAVMAVPFLRNGAVAATLGVEQRGTRAWSAAEVQVLRDLADRCWGALERARAEAGLRERERSQAFLIAWSDSVRAKVDARTALATTLATLGEHLGASRVNYGEATEARDALEVVQEWRDGVVSVVGQSFPLAALGERVIADHLGGAPFVVEDVERDPRFDEGNRPLYRAVGVASVCSIPLVDEAGIVAILSVQDAAPRRWTEAEVSLMRDVADRAWAVLERARSEERLAESEALLAAFMENAPLGMHIKDEDGRYIRINPELAQAMGRPAEAMLGRRPDEILPPETAAVLEGIEARARGGELASAEIAGTRADRWRSLLAIVFPIAGRGRARTAGLTIDLTERKAAEDALARSREALFQTEKLSALGSLLAGVSHELNNPLSIVVAQSVMMERQARGLEIAERAQKVRRAADRCARIVQTFLAMARQKRPERKAVDLNGVVLAALELTEYGLRGDGVRVVCELAPGLPLLSADADQLHQITVNLLVNAQQALAMVPAATRVLTVRTAGAAGCVVLEIADTGPGVPREAERRIFEPFFTTKPQGEGTGMGLSFSQGLAEAHGGRLALVPGPGGGACFRLTLPIDAAGVLDEAAAEPVAAAPPGRRALVVDDEPEIAEALADFLSLEGFHCEIAGSGAAAKAQLAQGRWDLVVSDLRMPGIDGPQLHAWIAAERPDLLPRIGFATGDTLGAPAVRFLDAVRRPVLDKPFTPEAVRRFVSQLDLPDEDVT